MVLMSLSWSQSDRMMVAVGFNPRAARSQNNPRRSATHESVSGAMTPILFNRRCATKWILGHRGPWVEIPRLPSKHRSAMVSHASSPPHGPVSPVVVSPSAVGAPGSQPMKCQCTEANLVPLTSHGRGRFRISPLRGLFVMHPMNARTPNVTCKVPAVS